MKLLQTFLKNKNLEISPDKTAFVVFTKKHINLDNLNVKVNNYTYTPTTTAKILGITLHYKLDWSVHISQLVKRTTDRLNMMKFMAKKSWGAGPKMMLTFYKAAIRSIFEYSAQILDCINSSLLEKLDKIQRKALRIALGYRDSTPNKILIAESGVPNLKVRFLNLTRKYYIKNYSIMSSPVIKSIKDLDSSIKKKYKTDTTKINQVRKSNFSYNAWCFIENKIEKDVNKNIIKRTPYHSYFLLDPRLREFNIPIIKTDSKLFGDDKEFNNKSKDIFENLYGETISKDIVFYTDGSKSETRVGFASYCPQVDWYYSDRISNLASIFTAEAYAILKTLEFIGKNNFATNTFTIFTDSLSVLTTLSSNSSTNSNSSFIIDEIRTEIFNLHLTDKKVTFVWIPSHVGIPGNEDVDSLAKNALKINNISSLKIPYTDAYSLANAALKNHQTSILKETFKDKGVFYFNNFFHENFSLKPWFQSFPDDRALIVSFVRLRANHTSLSQSLFRKNIIENPSCPCGFPEENLFHFFFECPLYHQQRKKLRSCLKKSKIKFNLTSDLINILKNPKLSTFRPIAEFIKKTKLFV